MTLRLGDTAPNFQIATTKGDIDFHQWLGDSWAFFFSHPADFTPVCTTEMGRTAQLADEFAARHTQPLGLSTKFDEILRVIDALQLSDAKRIATPADWRKGDKVIIPPSIANDEAKDIFPQGWEEVRSYLRLTKV